ncbi:hypothetical protein OKN36_10650 [Furfurilactobacillus sp. OKN36]
MGGADARGFLSIVVLVMLIALVGVFTTTGGLAYLIFNVLLIVQLSDSLRVSKLPVFDDFRLEDN